MNTTLYRAIDNSTDGSVTVNVSDEKGSATLQQNKTGKTFSSTDSKGQLLYHGPVDTEEQRKALPPELLEKLKRMEAPLRGSETGAGGLSPQSRVPVLGEIPVVGRLFRYTETDLGTSKATERR